MGFSVAVFASCIVRCGRRRRKEVSSLNIFQSVVCFSLILGEVLQWRKFFDCLMKSLHPIWMEAFFVDIINFSSVLKIPVKPVSVQV